MSWWMKWGITLVCTIVVFAVFGWLSPLTLVIDRCWKRGNEIGRPLLDVLIITGLPVLCARLIQLPLPGLLIPITFFLTQYAVLSGRFLEREFNAERWVMLISTIIKWVAFFTV